MGNKLVHPYIECPICLESNNMMLKLNCSHSFDTYCIQKHLMIDYHNSNHPRCPYCRTNLYSELRKIFKKWNIIDYRVDDISVKNEFDLTTIYNKIKITKLHSIDVNIDEDKGTIIIPFFNNTYIPIFFNQKNITKMIQHNIPFTQISNNFETMDFSNGCMLECFFNGSHYKKFLEKMIFKDKNVNKLFMNNFNQSIMDMYTISDICISFYIKNMNNVICIDDNGITNEFNLIDNKSCNILYRTYFLIYKKKFHIINEVYRIIYN
jgi:hypothetical protein